MMELWMVIVGITVSLSGGPQIFRIWQRKTSDDISLTVWILSIHGIIWWLIYGIHIESISLIITNTVCLIFESFVLFMILKYRTKKIVTIQKLNLFKEVRQSWSVVRL